MHFCVIAILLGLASVCLLQILSGDRSILSDYYHLCATVVSLYHLCVLARFRCCVHLDFDPAQCGTTCVFYSNLLLFSLLVANVEMLLVSGDSILVSHYCHLCAIEVLLIPPLVRFVPNLSLSLLVANVEMLVVSDRNG